MEARNILCVISCIYFTASAIATLATSPRLYAVNTFKVERYSYRPGQFNHTGLQGLRSIFAAAVEDVWNFQSVCISMGQCHVHDITTFAISLCSAARCFDLSLSYVGYGQSGFTTHGYRFLSGVSP